MLNWIQGEIRTCRTRIERALLLFTIIIIGFRRDLMMVRGSDVCTWTADVGVRISHCRVVRQDIDDVHGNVWRTMSNLEAMPD